MNFFRLLGLLVVLTGCSGLTSQKPLAPSDLTAKALADNRILLQWRDWSDNEDGFAIFEAPKDIAQFGLVTRTNPNVDSVYIAGRTPAMEYRYYVCAFRGEQFSQPTAIVSVTIPINIAPNAPSQLQTVLDGMRQVSLNWQDNAANEDGFEIFRQSDGDTVWIRIRQVGADVRTFADTETSPGRTYLYRVRAFNSRGTSDFTNASLIQAYSAKFIQVEHPNGGEVFQKGDKIIVRWKSHSDLGIVRLTFYTAENFWYKVSEGTMNDGLYEFADVGSLLASSTYKARVSASDPSLFDESDGYWTVK
ncbi:MAG: fibronectin type III domain-containing protein [Calditrichaeota bacterium]|nr:fibronectin type III domain-containing protein [Calditrichota bacterium]